MKDPHRFQQDYIRRAAQRSDMALNKPSTPRFMRCSNARKGAYVYAGIFAWHDPQDHPDKMWVVPCGVDGSSPFTGDLNAENVFKMEVCWSWDGSSSGPWRPADSGSTRQIVDRNLDELALKAEEWPLVFSASPYGVGLAGLDICDPELFTYLNGRLRREYGVFTRLLRQEVASR